ncbi:hypothetical protein BJ875DRAFT_476184 [Amylocarpus encephaloides]|uniref:Uncharacterized protein n=1 Tax=Amylocarpus encephaloides TaxID=45428 RepID=A0A9P7Y8B8_9HELO|nr:hypothetical protein BJ875DRAFT_476184 [Amylocarpus encephaloides]
MDHDDVNSSDIEYEPTANEFAGAGAQSVDLMLGRAVENRLESKKAAKQLQFVQNSKKTMYINYLWYNRFLAFRRGTLRIPDSAVPIGEHLERFLRSIVSSVVPRLGDVPSYRWLQQGVGHLVNAIVFHYKDFTLSSHERSRIACTLNDLFHAGKLTKDVARDKHFVGAFLVQKLSSALFTDALRNGTNSG